MDAAGLITRYGEELARLLAGAQANGLERQPLSLDAATTNVLQRLKGLGTGRVMFIGNGGSAGIASHLAIDYQKNGGFPTLCFNDGAALTCLGNDFGFEQIFSAPIKVHARAGDVLFAISSSGRSADIIKAVAAARERETAVITLSGFDAENPLRGLGDINFFVDSRLYGYVEIAHLAICHAILDRHMGIVR